VPSRGRRRHSLPLALAIALAVSPRHKQNKQSKAKAKAKPHLLAPHLVVCFSSVRNTSPCRLHYRAVPVRGCERGGCVWLCGGGGDGGGDGRRRGSSSRRRRRSADAGAGAAAAVALGGRAVRPARHGDGLRAAVPPARAPRPPVLLRRRQAHQGARPPCERLPLSLNLFLPFHAAESDISISPTACSAMLFSPRRRAVSTFPWREYVGCCVALAQSIRRRDIVSIGFSISPFVWPGPAARRPRFWSADARLLD
jgi:hypothetical protein